MSDWAIDVKGLTKRYDDKVVVDGVDLKISPGQVCGFLGPNGSGKTTTIRMLCGLLRPDAGRGQCLGFDLLTQSDQIKREVGYMTQKFGLYEDLSIKQNLDFVARLFELSNRAEQVDQTLQRLGLQERQHQLAGALSGGWKQRLALAACLIHQPKLLLLDEPTAGVDPKARREFWDQIHHLAAQGMTVLVSTHYMDEAERCHELFYIAYGKMLAHGTQSHIIEQSRLNVMSVPAGVDETTLNSLRQSEGILSVAAFGNDVHVSAQDPSALAHAVSQLPPSVQRQARTLSPNLEDVFISLIANAQKTQGVL